MSKKVLLFILLALLWIPAAAQGSSDSTYTFRFVPQKDMFYVPWSGNGAELDRLLACIARNKEAILEGKIPVRVDGYCTSQSTASGNLAMAKIRSNRVKSEMILRGGLTEACFQTENHASDGNYVTVRLVIAAAESAHAEPSAAELEARRQEAGKAKAERRAEQERQAEGQRKAEEARLAAEQAEAAQAAEPAETVPPVLEESRDEALHTAAKRCASSLALRANLLRWATLTPDLGVEWRIGNRWSVGVNGSWTSWTWKGVDRRYALWEVAPEVRCYMGKERRGYLGVMFKAGQFNYKLSDTGRQGDLMGGGLTGGYVLPIGKRLSLDFSLGLGYLNADYEKYAVIDGVRVRQGNETKGWWGPVNAGITLKWNLF